MSVLTYVTKVLRVVYAKETVIRMLIVRESFKCSKEMVTPVAATFMLRTKMLMQPA